MQNPVCGTGVSSEAMRNTLLAFALLAKLELGVPRHLAVLSFRFIVTIFAAVVLNAQAATDDNGSYNPDTKILISRAPEGKPITVKPSGLFSIFRDPKTKRVPAFTAAIQAGGRGNHSDIGSYVIMVGSEQLVGDHRGFEHYTADVIDKKHYDSPLMNSYGHPVPVVAGKLQRRDMEVKPEVLTIKRDTEFERMSGKHDLFRIDMRSAYDVPELVRLIRGYFFNRNDSSVMVGDHFEFTEPQTFETAIIVNGEWKQLDTRKESKKMKLSCQCGGSLSKTHPEEMERMAMFTFSRNGEEIYAWVSASEPFLVVTETIPNADESVTRLGLRFKEPAQKGYISVSFFDFEALANSATP